MPLIIVTGLPCSGKTFRAKQILQDFESRINVEPASHGKRKVVFLPSYHASLDPAGEDLSSYTPPNQESNPRDETYNSAKLEKTARAEEFSAAKRAVSKNVVVIADAPNYIKGFRYQLWCEAKAAGTRCVVVHAAAREAECTRWNQTRIESRGWNYHTAENMTTSTDLGSNQVSGPKIGRDVLGDLVPESHTAIYGDSVANGHTTTRSRSSSMGGPSSTDNEDDSTVPQRPTNDETMTLKSLYIASEHAQPAPAAPSDTPSRETAQATPSYPPPSSDPPPPLASLPYSPTTLTSLSMRYEPPSPFTRWDTPLFTVPSHDPHPPYAQIWAALFPSADKPLSKKQLSSLRREEQQAAVAKARKDQEEVKQHAATVLPQANSANALQVLEGTTAEVAKEVLRAAREGRCADAGVGGEVVLRFVERGTNSEGKEGDLEITLEVPEALALSQPALQRLRRKYTQIQRGGIAHGQGYVQGRRDIIEGFIQFLETEWDAG